MQVKGLPVLAITWCGSCAGVQECSPLSAEAGLPTPLLRAVEEEEAVRAGQDAGAIRDATCERNSCCEAAAGQV